MARAVGLAAVCAALFALGLLAAERSTAIPVRVATDATDGRPDLGASASARCSAVAGIHLRTLALCLIHIRIRQHWKCLDGGAIDFNVMTRRAQCQSTTSVLELISGGYFSRVVPGATTCFVHALSGEIAVQVVSCSVGLVPTTCPSVCVRSHESAVLEPSAGTKDSIVLEVHCAQHARFILVELTPSS
ncbi:hypothetical protein CAOG_010105 [Capsaspora owczarzaki ATCC 30864]|uniref:Uncharacterized protein n=1 Tax=Capsaspora owczarzaki (strain ATCC 30864) TaxID=595528 RepID=A0A0D2VZN5_CAPO3|nr:hypothetical protein CAOG_010105 [Capsaspora owczarzaki ATCC 30864]